MLTSAQALPWSASWAYDTGALEAGGATTVCFSRRLRDARATASPDLRTLLASSGAAAASGRHLLTAGAAAVGGWVGACREWGVGAGAGPGSAAGVQLGRRGGRGSGG